MRDRIRKEKDKLRKRDARQENGHEKSTVNVAERIERQEGILEQATETRHPCHKEPQMKNATVLHVGDIFSIHIIYHDNIENFYYWTRNNFLKSLKMAIVRHTQSDLGCTFLYR